MNAAPGIEHTSTPRCHNRLTIIGRRNGVKLFDNDIGWPAKFGARHRELQECSPTRLVWLFETDTPPLEQMKRLSLRHPRLTFLLEYDREDARVKGLAKARAGRLKSYRFRY